MNDAIQLISGTAAVLSLGACLGAAILLFVGVVDDATFKTTYLLATIVWFISATMWLRTRDVELEKEQGIHASQ